MNDTVARIVDLMFQNAEMTDEVSALHDEVMNNCQERYRDLVSRGVQEDDAIEAVIESLRGMEDVIAQYNQPAKKPESQPHEQPAPEAQPVHAFTGQQDLTFGPSQVTAIDVLLIDEDVKFVTASDGYVHVKYDAELNPYLDVQLDGATLKLHRTSKESNYRAFTRADTYARSGAVEDLTQAINEKRNGNKFDFESLGRAIGKFFRTTVDNITTSGDVTIALPAACRPVVSTRTTSGDVELHRVYISGLNIVSTSGDIDAFMPEDNYVQSIEMCTTSGDIDVKIYAASCTAASTSGSIDLNGVMQNVQATTISGDIDVRGDVEECTFKAVSGDVEMAFSTTHIRNIQGSTVSGDIDVDLPLGIGSIGIQTKTRSGGITTRYSTNGNGPTVYGGISTMSGDIIIR